MTTLLAIDPTPHNVQIYIGPAPTAPPSLPPSHPPTLPPLSPPREANFRSEYRQSLTTVPRTFHLNHPHAPTHTPTHTLRPFRPSASPALNHLADTCRLSSLIITNDVFCKSPLPTPVSHSNINALGKYNIKAQILLPRCHSYF
jgi:hypothetical protein